MKKTVKPGNVYGFTGNPKSGKRSICQYRSEFHGAVHVRFGQQLIAITRLLYTLTDSHFNEVNQSKEISEEFTMTPLALMERTKDAIETYEQDENFMLKQTMNRIQSFIDKGHNVWISNVNSNKEAETLKKRFKATIVLLRRKSVSLNGYQGVDKRFIDLEIDNDGSLDELYKFSNYVVDSRLSNARKVLTCQKNSVLNNAKEHLGEIARDLLNAEILDQTKMSECYKINKDGTREFCAYKMDSNSKLDLILRECHRQLALLISEETGAE